LFPIGSLALAELFIPIFIFNMSFKKAKGLFEGRIEIKRFLRGPLISIACSKKTLGVKLKIL
jgi:hypothetical protein